MYNVYQMQNKIQEEHYYVSYSEHHHGKYACLVSIANMLRIIGYDTSACFEL